LGCEALGKRVGEWGSFGFFANGVFFQPKKERKKQTNVVAKVLC
jgi:hypothetical protein